MQKYPLYLDEKKHKWDMIYILNTDKLINLKKIINNLYNQESFAEFKKYKIEIKEIDEEIKCIADLITIEPEKIYFFNNIIFYLIFSSIYILAQYDTITKIIQYESSILLLKDFLINVQVYKNKDDKNPTFTGMTFLGIIGFFSCKNKDLNISLNCEKFHPDDFLYKSENPALSIREIFTNDLSYTFSKELLSSLSFRNPCSFVILNRNKYKIISRKLVLYKDISDVYYFGTFLKFYIKTYNNFRHEEIKKKVIESNQPWLVKNSVIEKLLFGESVKLNSLIENDLKNEPYITNSTLFYYISSISNNYVFEYILSF